MERQPSDEDVLLPSRQKSEFFQTLFTSKIIFLKTLLKYDLLIQSIKKMLIILTYITRKNLLRIVKTVKRRYFIHSNNKQIILGVHNGFLNDTMWKPD